MSEKFACDGCGELFDKDNLMNVLVEIDEQGNGIYEDLCSVCLNKPTATDEAHERYHYDDYDDERAYCAYCGARQAAGYCWKSPDGMHHYDD